MNSRRRHIAVVTGSRAEFGLLDPVMAAIRKEPRLRLSVIVTGTHLTAGTWRGVAAAGYSIAARVPMQRAGETGRAADVQALARGVAGLGRAFAKVKPDVVLVLGDRIEALAAALAASIGGLYVAHIHGGDRAEGVADEAMRHALSKLAHLHFPATPTSRKRLICMGEPPECVWNVGSPSIDLIRDAEKSIQHRGHREERDQGWEFRDQGSGFRVQGPGVWVQGSGDGGNLKSVISYLKSKITSSSSASPTSSVSSVPSVNSVFNFFDGGVIVLQHPVGAEDEQERRWMAGTLAATTGFPRLLLAPNGDPGCRGVRAALRASAQPVVEHLPRGEFVALLARAGAIVGNSSAGLIEAAALRTPCVNIGPRQSGREKPNNVIDCDYGPAHVRAALHKALALDRPRIRHPYGDGQTGPHIARLLATVDLARVPLRKHNTF